MLNAEKAQFNAKTSILKLESAITTQTADKQAFIASWTSKLNGEITAKNEELTQLKQEKIKLSRLVDNIIVRSPAEGIVLDLPEVSRGGVVSEGEAIVTLVQSNQPLFLEIDIDPKEIPDMKIGMKVSVKLDERFPIIPVRAIENSATKEFVNEQKKLLSLIDKKKISLYACGPTVYDSPHVGNARSLVVFDVLYRILKTL